MKEYIQKTGPRWYASSKLGSANLDTDVIAISPPGSPTTCAPTKGWRIKIPCDQLHRGTALNETHKMKDQNIVCKNQESNFGTNYELKTICLDGKF